ncbi:hypothetical protein K438DRAFT_1853612 [Mycena galopus ATCC 62051]|nr:hypothetical protein K438DRAFT_1853612 [Mycena galopus ATCC 62051]
MSAAKLNPSGAEADGQGQRGQLEPTVSGEGRDQLGRLYAEGERHGPALCAVRELRSGIKSKLGQISPIALCGSAEGP